MQLMIFLLVIIGFCIRKKGIVGTEGRKNMVDLCLFVTLPFNIIHSFFMEWDWGMMVSCAIVLLSLIHILFEHPQKVAAAKLTGCKNIEEIVWKDGKHLYVPGWDMVIPAGMGNVGDAQAIGIRAHEFTTERTESDGELVFPVYKPEVKEDLFEYHVQFFTSERAKTPVVWKVSKKLWDVGEKDVYKRQDLTAANHSEIGSIIWS